MSRHTRADVCSNVISLPEGDRSDNQLDNLVGKGWFQIWEAADMGTHDRLFGNALIKLRDGKLFIICHVGDDTSSHLFSLREDQLAELLDDLNNTRSDPNSFTFDLPADFPSGPFLGYEGPLPSLAEALTDLGMRGAKTNPVDAVAQVL